MIDWGKTVIATVVVFAATAGVYADMTPMSPVQGGEYEQASLQPVDLSNSLMGPGIVDLGTLSVAFLPTAEADVEEFGEAQQSLQLSGDDKGSFDLCLYALISLGLCRSGQWVKKISLDFVPAWYHDGGPYQVGHSRVIEPSLCSLPVLCFVQPDYVREGSGLRRGVTMIASGCRKSQFTPGGCVSRGPPLLAQESFAV